MQSAGVPVAGKSSTDRLYLVAAFQLSSLRALMWIVFCSTQSPCAELLISEYLEKTRKYTLLTGTVAKSTVQETNCGAFDAIIHHQLKRFQYVRVQSLPPVVLDMQFK